MKRFLGLIAVALAACTSEPEELQTGIGFGSLEEYRAIQDAELQGATTASPVPEPLAVGTETAGTVTAANAGAPLSAIPADAAAVRQNPAAAPVVAAPVPTRPGTQEPNIVAYALATSHPVGTSVYPRNAASASRTQSACARYSSSDQAQIDFLKSGGPERDSKGLDPDGDGYACAWDPSAFRNTRSGG